MLENRDKNEIKGYNKKLKKNSEEFPTTGPHPRLLKKDQQQRNAKRTNLINIKCHKKI
jgi:hypothetical protein